MNPVSICHLIIILGISGDLARKKILPTLWSLYNKDLLPPNTFIVGFARSDLTVQSLHDKVAPYVGLRNESERVKHEHFWTSRVHYVRGKTTTELEDYDKLNGYLAQIESGFDYCHRLFYLALPPHIYTDVAKSVHKTSLAQRGWTRIVLEKPFGSDLESSNNLSAELSQWFDEDQIYRMDHYLGKEMVQNILPFRFGNQIFEPIWNRNWIEVVEILFKESFGTFGRGAYFDKFGIIRDVIQNHLLQVLCLVAMEEPVSLFSNDVRNRKVELLKQINTLKLEDVVLGQYVRNPDSAPGEESNRGYVDDDTVANNSRTATYALTVLHIDNSRWQGVPFVIRGGKALDSNQIEVRIYFKTRPNLYSKNDYSEDPQNVLIMRIQPNEAIVQRIRLKRPGLSSDILESTLDLVYSNKFQNADIPDAYEQLILDVFHSKQVNFVRTDELEQAWRIFTPILHDIDRGDLKPFPYVFGSSSLSEADAYLEKRGLYNLI